MMCLEQNSKRWRGFPQKHPKDPHPPLGVTPCVLSALQSVFCVFLPSAWLAAFRVSCCLSSFLPCPAAPCEGQHSPRPNGHAEPPALQRPDCLHPAQPAWEEDPGCHHHEEGKPGLGSGGQHRDRYGLLPARAELCVVPPPWVPHQLQAGNGCCWRLWKGKQCWQGSHGVTSDLAAEREQSDRAFSSIALNLCLHCRALLCASERGLLPASDSTGSPLCHS